MKKILFTEKTFTILCLLFMVVYLFLNFTTINQALLFVATTFLLIYSLALFINILKKVIIGRISVVIALRQDWVGILLLTGAVLLIYFLGGWHFLSALLLGLLMFALSIAIYYLLKKNISK